MSQLIPALAITVGPALPLLAAAVAFQPSSVHPPRHRTDTVRAVAADWTPLDGRVRAAVAHYAGRRREVIA